MPGLAGIISDNEVIDPLRLTQMLDELHYGRSGVCEHYKDTILHFGCVHSGLNGTRNIYESDEIAVAFFGYLTQPSISLESGQGRGNSAARKIHDLYLEHGEGFIANRLAGAFAFAVWDKRKRTMLLASDHLGLRPIYYAKHNGIFLFSSEVKGILVDPTFPHKIDLDAISEFFHFSYVCGEKTFFHDIKLLPPGSVLRYHEGSWSIFKYWDVAYPDHYPNLPDRCYDEMIYDALDGAVLRMSNPNLSFGLSLSGGMDSRWIAAFMSKHQPQSTSFTLGSPGSDDTPLAQNVARLTGLANTYWDLDPGFVAEHAATYVYISDGMYDLFGIEEFPLTVRVGNFVDVSVGGLLGDCLFGHEINPVSTILRKQDVKSYWLWRYKGDWLQQSIGDKVFGKKQNREFEARSIESLNKLIETAPFEHGYQILQYINLRNRQPRFINIAQQAKLPYVDIYHPIADNTVVQTALQIPPDQLMMERAYRRSMGAYFPDLAKIPWTFTLTPPTISVPGILLKKVAQLTIGRQLRGSRLGESSYIRPRKYYCDYSQWSRTILRPFIEETLLSSKSNAADLFDMNGMRTVINEHMENINDATSFIGRALAVVLWTQLFYSSTKPIRPKVFALDHNA